MKKAKMVVLSVLLVAFAFSMVASASDLWPGWFKKGSQTTKIDHGTTGGTTTDQTYSVAEPAAILLLGAGLVTLGIYAKRKRGKQQ